MGGLDGERDHAPGSGDAVGVVEFLPFAVLRVLAGAVEKIETERDLEGGVGGNVAVGLVVEVGIPGHYLSSANCVWRRVPSLLTVVCAAFKESAALSRGAERRILAVNVKASRERALIIDICSCRIGRITSGSRDLSIIGVRVDCSSQVVRSSIFSV